MSNYKKAEDIVEHWADYLDNETYIRARDFRRLELDLAAALNEAYESGRKDENEACAKAVEDSDPDGAHELCADAIRQRVPNAPMPTEGVKNDKG